MKRAHPEADIQRAVVAYLHAVLVPGSVVHASGHELRAHGPHARRMQGIATGMGAHKGWPDLVVLSGLKVAFLEVKAEGGRLTPEQQAFAELARAQGHSFDVVRSVEDAREALADAGIWTREVTA